MEKNIKGGVYMLNKGAIIAIKEDVYISFPGGSYNDHFVNKKKFYALCAFPSNNGNVLIKDKSGRKFWFNVNVQKYELVKGACV